MPTILLPTKQFGKVSTSSSSLVTMSYLEGLHCTCQTSSSMQTCKWPQSVVKLRDRERESDLSVEVRVDTHI